MNGAHVSDDDPCTSCGGEGKKWVTPRQTPTLGAIAGPVGGQQAPVGCEGGWEDCADCEGSGFQAPPEGAA